MSSMFLFQINKFSLPGVNAEWVNSYVNKNYNYVCTYVQVEHRGSKKIVRLRYFGCFNHSTQ